MNPHHRIVRPCLSVPVHNKAAILRKESIRILKLIQGEAETRLWDAPDRHSSPQKLYRSQSVDSGLLFERPTWIEIAPGSTSKLLCQQIQPENNNSNHDKLRKRRNQLQRYSGSGYRTDDELSENDTEKSSSRSNSFLEFYISPQSRPSTLLEWQVDSDTEISKVGTESKKRDTTNEYRDSGIEHDDDESSGPSVSSSFREIQSDDHFRNFSLSSKNTNSASITQTAVQKNIVNEQECEERLPRRQPSRQKGKFMESCKSGAKEIPAKFQWLLDHRHLMDCACSHTEDTHGYHSDSYLQAHHQLKDAWDIALAHGRRAASLESLLDKARAPFSRCRADHNQCNNDCIFDVSLSHGQTNQRKPKKHKNQTLHMDSEDDSYYDDITYPTLRQIFTHGKFTDINYLVTCVPDFDVNSSDYFGNTALHYSAIRGDLKILDLLLSSGANVWTRNKTGQLPVDLSTNLKCAKMLTSATMFFGSKNDWKLENLSYERASIKDIIYEL